MNSERNSEILRMYAEGAKLGEIASSLGLSRGVVAGVIDRSTLRGETGWHNRRVEERSPRKTRSPAADKPTLHLPIQAAPPPDDQPGVHLLNAHPHHCRWVIGRMRFCGRPKVQGRSFCEDHTAIAYTTYARKA